ncbi:hypothetical protein [Picosynechococcus sp. PCC 7117]|nr:hypothetical protein [Picosynechococcus sp. PCC 7117]
MATTHNVMGNPSQSKKLNPQILINFREAIAFPALGKISKLQNLQAIS